MSLLNKEVEDFSVNAYHKDSFCTVEKKDICRKVVRWLFFYPADFSQSALFCPTELEDLQNPMWNFRRLVVNGVQFNEMIPITSFCSQGLVMMHLPRLKAGLYPLQAFLSWCKSQPPRPLKYFRRERSLMERGSFIVNPGRKDLWPMKYVPEISEEMRMSFSSKVQAPSSGSWAWYEVPCKMDTGREDLKAWNWTVGKI